MSLKTHFFILASFTILISCKKQTPDATISSNLNTNRYSNILDYQVSPDSAFDKSGLMFSDQGAWFAFSFPNKLSNDAGFSGPFLMTLENGIWSSKNLARLRLKNTTWKTTKTTSFNSHLEQIFTNDSLQLQQKLVFSSPHTAIIQSTITNTSNLDKTIEISWTNSPLLTSGLQLTTNKNEVIIASNKTTAMGYLRFPKQTRITSTDSTYITQSTPLILNPNQSVSFIVSQTFIFPEYSWSEEKSALDSISFNTILERRIQEKTTQISALQNQIKPKFDSLKYKTLLVKAMLTMQNNWRIPAGELKHEGLFPSYHYKWFHGFWSWDSWKHAVGLSYYDTRLAKNQMLAMFDYQREDGFVIDCIYRDTTIEPHNTRDTKPPLAAWAVLKIYKKDNDLSFVKTMYPKLKKYHSWWYTDRDHDQDGLCEYGSTDGTVIAAKWESGMDNAIRFDTSKILKNHDGAYSINQESVDLNAYLYAEKCYLAELAKILELENDANQYTNESEVLKSKIQKQFFDPEDGWFYDTNLEGNSFIKGEGSEGWTALWAKAATQEQAHAVAKKMMDPKKFFTLVPFQTMSADHPKFNPLKGYWRGPNWLDQAYFGVQGLRNYNFIAEANKATKQILNGGAGILDQGKPLYENYHPITGEGLNAANFSWSAAHIIMLLSED